MFLPQSQRAVHVRMRDRPAGIGLEGKIRNLPNFPELVELAQVGVARAERLIEIVRALEDRGRAAKAAAREQRRDDAGVRRPAGMEPLGPSAVGEIFDNARALAAADAEGVHPLLLL